MLRLDGWAVVSASRKYSIGANVLEEALRQWPDDVDACFPLGVIYRSQKRESEAKNLLAKVPDEMLKQHNNLVFAASMYETNNNMHAASDAWLQFATLGNKSPAVYQHLAQAAVAAEKWDAAYTAFDALSKTSLNDVDTLNSLAAVADKLNKKQEAIAALEKSLQLNSAQPEVATEMGLMKLKLGDKNGAYQAFEKAVAADPSFEPAVKYLEKMRPRKLKNNRSLLHLAFVYIKIRIDLLHVVVVVDGFVEFHHRVGVAAFEADVVLRDHRDLGGLRFDAGGF